MKTFIYSTAVRAVFLFVITLFGTLFFLNQNGWAGNIPIPTNFSATQTIIMPEPGPMNDGLRLRLSISTERRDEIDVFSIRLGILNVSTDTITLTGTSRIEGIAKDYTSFVKSAVMSR